MNNIDTTYINFYKSNFRTIEDKKAEQENAEAFSEYCIINPTELKSLFDWYFNIYFEGLHENSNTIAFKVDLEKAAQEGQTKIVLFDDRKELVMLGSCVGMFGFIFSREFGLDKTSLTYVYKIMEHIRFNTNVFAFKKIDWNYFFSELWYDVLFGIYNRYIQDKNLLITCFIADCLRNKLNHYGLELKYILDDETKIKRSGLGIDLGYLFVHDTEPIVLNMSIETCA